MRSCIVSGCMTNSCNPERSLFEINEARQEWISVIQTNQPLNNATKIYICDVHFDPKDLIQNGKNLRPKKNILPFRNVNTNTNGISSNNLNNEQGDGATSSSESRRNFSNGNSCSTSNMKAISMEEYRKLCNCSIELCKANKTIDKLNATIQKKDAMIEKLTEKCKTEHDHLSSEQSEVIDTLINGLRASRLKYSPAVRKFCFRIQFHSSCAYRELRKFFGNKLPTVRTLQRWLKVVDDSPGITRTALDSIADIAKSYKEKGEQLHLCLISDEISIAKQALWNENAESFEGFSGIVNSTDHNGRDNNDKLPLAKDALVLMAVGPSFRITVAYQFLSGLDAIDRASFTREVIRSVDGTGARVISLTGDGLHANKMVAQLLGANFENNQPFFPRPSQPNQKIYILFDPPHMIKLLRKYFAEQQLQHGNDDIKWELLEILAKRQDTDNFSFGNKLTQNHIDYKNCKMKVYLAVETLSNSVADSIEQLSEDGYEDFIGSEKTVEFIRYANNIFDIMNYGEKKKTDDQFKQPLCAESIDKFRSFFEKYNQFVAEITINIKYNKNTKRVPAIKTMGFMGLYINIQSTIGIYEDYVQNGPLDVFYTFQYSQDHLETYFSLIRGSLGANINPNVTQFRSAYRKLLFCTPHISGGTNCNVEFPDALLEVSSVPQSETTSNIDPLRATAIEISEEYETLIVTELAPYEQHVNALVASTIEKDIIRIIKAQTVSACQDCLNVFDENTRINDNFIAKKQHSGQRTKQPCISTMNILLASNEIMKILQCADYIDFQTMVKTIFNKLDIDLLYQASLFDSHVRKKHAKSDLITHKEEFILNIIKKYLHMKSINICRRITTEEQGEAIERRKLRRDIILAGQ